MRVIKSYNKFKESLVIDLMMSSVDILESMNIWHDVLLSAISAEEKDIFDTLKLPKDFYQERLDLNFLSDNIEFINSLSSLGLKKSQVQVSDDYETFLNKPCKWMFIYDISSNELENPIYLLFQSWNNSIGKWEDVKLYSIYENIQRFYDKLSSKTIEVNDGDENFIYKTTNKNEWTLQNIEKENDIYKKYFRNDELESFLNDRKVTVSII